MAKAPRLCMEVIESRWHEPLRGDRPATPRRVTAHGSERAGEFGCEKCDCSSPGSRPRCATACHSHWRARKRARTASLIGPGSLSALANASPSRSDKRRTVSSKIVVMARS
jgi:hypothetical protein